MSAYYNDNDPFCAEWLRRLIAAGAIPAGEVDERSIADVEPGDLRGYRHCHFFAGIGGFAYACALAGWDMDRPLWTGSAPCQPFSSAGRQGGATDERHLWPRWLRLIRECRPDTIIGEQVEGAVGFGWVDRVFADLEAEGYACGAAVLGAHSIGAPHLRQRLFWVANSARVGRNGAADAGRERQADQPQRGLWGEPERSRSDGGALDNAASARHASAGRGQPAEPEWRGGVSGMGCAVGGLADAGRQRRQQVGRGALGDEGADGRQPDGDHIATGDGAAGGLADADEAGSDRQRRQGLSGDGDAPHGHDIDGRGKASGVGNADAARPQGRRIDAGEHAGQRAAGETGAGFWSDAVWLPCLDGKARRVEPTIQPLAHGIPNRVGLLRGSGNAVVPQVAATFIRAVMEVPHMNYRAPAVSGARDARRANTALPLTTIVKDHDNG